MKKLIGIIGVAVIAMAMFFNTNTMNGSNGDFDLASLLTINTANAECRVTCEDGTWTECYTHETSCSVALEGGHIVVCPNALIEWDW